MSVQGLEVQKKEDDVNDMFCTICPFSLIASIQAALQRQIYHMNALFCNDKREEGWYLLQYLVSYNF